MSMFDYITCNYKLPQPLGPTGFKGTVDFQTKDLDNCLLNYIIDEDGLLWVKKQIYKELTKEQEEKNKKASLFCWEHPELEREWLEPVEVTQTINIYDFVYDEDADYWIEYNLTFIKGKILDAELVNFERKDNSGRIESEAEFKLKLKKRGEFVDSFKFKYFYRYTNWLVKKMCRMMDRLGSSIRDLSYKLQHKLIK